MSDSSIAPIITALISSISAIIIKLIEIHYRRKNSFLKSSYYLCIVIAIISMGLLIKLIAFPYEKKVSIIYPKTNGFVEQTALIEGTHKHISKNEKLWIFINPINTNRYYPQNSFSVLDANGKWSTLVYLGQKNDVGKKFEIIAVLVKKDAIKEIKQYLIEANNKQDWAGMEKIPENALIYERIFVIRK